MSETCWLSSAAFFVSWTKDKKKRFSCFFPRAFKHCRGFMIFTNQPEHMQHGQILLASEDVAIKLASVC